MTELSRRSRTRGSIRAEWADEFWEAVKMGLYDGERRRYDVVSNGTELQFSSVAGRVSMVGG
ncbi:hypothetical protein CASFOL_005441 [Castilleja foliolosa]|uniref:Uncharacterized protein n=1 Tax=Castilleja foliolosa TaxID=1961234 RepID=A0ABD3E3S1_9LAMI